MQRKHASLPVVTIGLLLATACAPTAPGPVGGAESRAAPQIEKTLTLMIQREPPSFETAFTGGGTNPRAGGVNQVPPIVSTGLTLLDENGVVQPRLAAEVPDQSRATWLVNPDGSMDVTWKLRPDAYWHDGVPVTSEDVLFGFDARKALGISVSGGTVAITGVRVLDSRTFVVHWAGVFVQGNQTGVGTLPKHILGDVFAQDPNALINHRYFTSDYVGTGPFKLVEWAAGSHMEFRRNEQYFMGVPRISRLFLRFVPDQNTMAANMLAEAADVALPIGIENDTALEIRDRWAAEGKGHQVIPEVTGAVVNFEMMEDPLYARPLNGWLQIPVRQALYHAMDREALTQAVTGGLSLAADSIYAPTDPYYPQVKGAIPQYPYDPRRARELMAQAGWAPGADGVLVHQPSGERFDTNLLLFPGAQYLKLGAIVTDYWKTVGVNTSAAPIAPAFSGNVEYLTTRSGPQMGNVTTRQWYLGKLHTSHTPNATNRWTGNNYGRTNSPVMDDLVDKLQFTLDPAQQGGLHRELQQLIMGEVHVMPLFYESWTVLMLKGVTGPSVISGADTHKIYEWDKN